jgi:hypothetical protein
MNKYPKRQKGCYWGTDCGRAEIEPGVLFQEGSAYMHAPYLLEMKAKHPIMYWLWYRWWIPSLLQPDEREQLKCSLVYYRRFKFRPYWADFALYHPVQFLVYLLLVHTIQSTSNICKKLFSTPVQIVFGSLKISAPKNGVDNILDENIFVEKSSNVPSD